MIAIAESGSTKCQWVLLDGANEQVASFNTRGFNPYFHSSEFVRDTLSTYEELMPYAEKCSAVYFYGAGCSSKALNKIMHDGIQEVFPNAKVEIDHDLLAAAYALYEGEPLVACILGTGSNSGYFDGQKLIDLIPSLGFILGDEASGSFYGRQLLTDFFYKRLPAPMQEDFEKTYGLSWGEALKKVYRNEHANVFLASFMPFVAKYQDESYVKDMIRTGVGKFLDVHVACFSEYGKAKVGFVGSLADIFRDLIQEELDARNLVAGPIIRRPINELVNYHLKYKELQPAN